MYNVYLVAIIASVSRETQGLDCSNVSRETFFIKKMVSVKNTAESENQFVVDLLTTLRQEKFSPRGWWCFFRRSWEISCKTANDNPTLKRSWVLTTLLIATLAVAMILRSEEHTSELQSRGHLVCRLLLRHTPTSTLFPYTTLFRSENQFVVDLLTTLRQEKFSPRGWWCFFRRSWEISCKTANDNPTLKRSWVLTTLLIATLAVAMIL